MDKSQPSTNAVSASNLFRLGTMLNDEGLLKQARETVNTFEVEILQYPYLFIGLLTGVVALRLGVKVVSAKRSEESTLRQYYTSPRAEIRVLDLIPEESSQTVPETKADEEVLASEGAQTSQDQSKEGQNVTENTDALQPEPSSEAVVDNGQTEGLSIRLAEKKDDTTRAEDKPLPELTNVALAAGSDETTTKKDE